MSIFVDAGAPFILNAVVDDGPHGGAHGLFLARTA